MRTSDVHIHTGQLTLAIADGGQAGHYFGIDPGAEITPWTLCRDEALALAAFFRAPAGATLCELGSCTVTYDAGPGTFQVMGKRPEYTNGTPCRSAIVRRVDGLTAPLLAAFLDLHASTVDVLAHYLDAEDVAAAYAKWAPFYAVPPFPAGTLPTRALRS